MSFTHTATRIAASVAMAAVLAACSDSFDKSQVPRITLTPVIAAPLVLIRWEPAGAQQIQVYRGTVADGNAANLVWSISATSANSLASPIEYASNPPAGGATDLVAKPLEPGVPYTVQVGRLDPKGGAANISGTRFRYSNTQTFTLAAPNIAP